MYNVMVKSVPVMTWMTKKAEDIVNKFNNSGSKLMLSLYSEPENSEELDCMLEEGMYEFIYPNTPEAKELEKMVIEAEKYPRYLGFSLSDVY